MSIAKITLQEMLDARERRVILQNELAGSYGRPQLCFTMNIAGEVKQTPLIRLAFSWGEHRIREVLGSPIHYELRSGASGNESFWIYDKRAQDIKEAALKIESESSIGRLFDMDVLDENCEKLSRCVSRSCIVCGGPVSVCSRSRAHGLDAVTEKTSELLIGFAAGLLSQMAANALIREVHVTPKPGLVDENNNGSHKDMDIALFERSAKVLEPYFKEALLRSLTRELTFEELRSLGLEAEHAMRHETQGVNTHAGALYSFLILLSGIGASLRTGSNCMDEVRRLTRNEDSRDTGETHGSTVCKRYGVTGARGEAKRGFPTAEHALKMRRHYEDFELLLYIISRTKDTNLLHRGGEEGYTFAKSEALRVLAMQKEQRKAATLALDLSFIERGLSAGGAADILAMVLFLDDYFDLIGIPQIVKG